MVNQPQQFRQHHITRALKAAAAAGMRDPTVTVQLLPTGATITIGSGKVLPEGARHSVHRWTYRGWPVAEESDHSPGRIGETKMIAKPKPQHGVIFARGGSGPANRMVREQAAGPAKAGINWQKADPGSGGQTGFGRT